jgi:hypothetical protein
VDYALAVPARGDGERAVEDAERFLAQTVGWMEARARGD